MQNLMDDVPQFNRGALNPKIVGTLIKLFSTMFKKQRSSMEIRLNGLAELLRTGLIEFALPEFEKAVARDQEGTGRRNFPPGFVEALREANLYPTEEVPLACKLGVLECISWQFALRLVCGGRESSSSLLPSAT